MRVISLAPCLVKSDEVLLPALTELLVFYYCRRPGTHRTEPRETARAIPKMDPATADSAEFYLLCCQPKPIPLSLAARTTRLTPHLDPAAIHGAIDVQQDGIRLPESSMSSRMGGT